MAIARQVREGSTLVACDHSREACAIIGTPSALRFHMRSSIAAALVLLTSTPVLAGSGGPPPGRGDSSGRLGHVSGGLNEATSGENRDSGNAPSARDVEYGDPDYRGMYHARRDGEDIILLDNEERLVRRITPKKEPNRAGAELDLYFGLQKVIESDTSFSITAAVSDDWFRLAAYGSRYWEERMDGQGKLTMTMGGGTLGLPIQQGGRSHAYIEGGVVLLKTANDPTADTSITGGKLGIHLEQGLRKTTIIGDAHALLFEAGVKAWEARLGVRYGHFEGAFRVLDFNVGPALFGPELGLSF